MATTEDEEPTEVTAASSEDEETQDDITKESEPSPAELDDKQTRQKAAPKKAVVVIREEGRSLLPHSRVQKIIKADKELPTVAREAVFAISVATEEFVKKLATSSFREAERDSRTTVQTRDIAAIVKRSDEFFFLEDIID